VGREDHPPGPAVEPFGIPARLLLISLGLFLGLFPLPGRAGEPYPEALREKLKSYLLKPADLPKSWEIYKDVYDHDAHADILWNTRRMFEGSPNFAMKAQFFILNDEGQVLGAYVYTAADENARKRLLRQLKAWEGRMPAKAFRAVDAVFLACPQTPGTLTRLKDVVGRKHGLPILKRLRECVEKGRQAEAEAVLQTLLVSVPDSGEIHAGIAEVALRGFSPPKLDRTVKSCRAALKCNLHLPLPDEILWRVLSCAGEAHELRNELKAAKDAFEAREDLARRGGVRLQVQYHYDVARLYAREGDSDRSFDALQYAVKLDAYAGSGDLTEKFRKEPAFSSLLKEERFKALATKFNADALPEVYVDPKAVTIALKKSGTLVLPPVVFQEKAKRRGLEADAEEGFVRRLGSSGFFFGAKRKFLAKDGLENVAGEFCEHLVHTVIFRERFELAPETEDKPGFLKKLERSVEIARAYGVCKRRPDAVLCLRVDLAGGDGSKMPAKISAVYFRLGSNRIPVFLHYRATWPVKLLTPRIIALGREISARIERAVKKK
jgi:tetratricopeptide (TPR) repeat protein